MGLFSTGVEVAKDKAKSKAKKILLKLLVKLMIPWGLIIFIGFGMVLVLFTSEQGEYNDGVLNTKLSKEDNQKLIEYLQETTIKTNKENTFDSNNKVIGDFQDYFGNDVGYALKPEMVHAYTKYLQTIENKRLDQLYNQTSIADTDAFPNSKTSIDKACEDLKPTFKYKTMKIITEKKYKIKVSHTSTTTNADSTTSTSSSETIEDRCDKTEDDITVLNTVKALDGEFSMIYENKVTKYSYKDTKNSKIVGDVQVTVTEPEFKDRKIIGEENSTLKKIILAKNPKEDVSTVIAMIKNSGDLENNWLFNKYGEINGLEGGGIGGALLGGFESIPAFYQYDPRWGSIPYSSSCVAKAGCGPSSLAMVVTGIGGNYGKYDLNHDGILDPGEAAKFSKSHNCVIAGAGTTWNLFPLASKEFGINVKSYDASQWQTVYKELQNGKCAISSQGPGEFTRSGHFIVLARACGNGKVFVNDPGKEARTKEWSMKVVSMAARQYWVFDNPNGACSGAGGNYKITYYTGAVNEGGTGTAFGVSLSGKDIKDKLIAVDPKVIPLNSKVRIIFPNNIRQKAISKYKVDLNGIYWAVDTGSAIKQNKIDVYVGTGSKYQVMADDLGVTMCKVQVVQKGNGKRLGQR